MSTQSSRAPPTTAPRASPRSRSARDRRSHRRAPRAGCAAPDRPPRLRRRPGRPRAGSRRGRRRLRGRDGHRTSFDRASAPSASGWLRLLDAAVRHTSEREAFGKPLARFQAVGHQLAEVATQIQAARLLVSDAASQYDAGVRPVRKASAMAKLFATETAQRAVDVAIQVHGARPREGAPARTPLPRGARAADLRRRVRGAARDHCPRAVQGAPNEQGEVAQLHVVSGARGDPRRAAAAVRRARRRSSSSSSTRSTSCGSSS